jgi:hypothetical protein
MIHIIAIKMLVLEHAHRISNRLAVEKSQQNGKKIEDMKIGVFSSSE